VTDTERAKKLEEVLNRPVLKAITAETFREILRREIPYLTPAVLDLVVEQFQDTPLRVTPHDESEN
jgi:hypothetical protein